MADQPITISAEDARLLNLAASMAVRLYDAAEADGGVPSTAALYGHRDRLEELARLLDHEANCARGRGQERADADSVQRDVLDFHHACNLTIGETPALRDERLRADLILEEARETGEAITGRRVKVEILDEPAERANTLVEAIDGLCDLLCVVYGTAITFGVVLAPFWAEVHRSNMDKAGGPIRADGKQLKPAGWRPPDLDAVLDRHHPGARP